MKKLLTLTLLLVLPLLAKAYDAEVDGIYYNLDRENETATVTRNYYKEYYGSVDIPHNITYYGVEYSVTSLGKYAFEGCSNLTSVTIPNSVISIGELAFKNCTGLTSVTIPNSVTSIGGSAFVDCSGLTSVTIPNSVTSIGGAAFGGCSGLTSVTIPNSVTCIENQVFVGCSGLTSVTIPNSVTSIGDAAFLSCTSLTSLIIPNSVISIGELAFKNCTGLTSVTIPNSVISIGEDAFSDCASLISVTIPGSVTSIGSQAFYNCSSLTSVYINDLISWCKIDFETWYSNPLTNKCHLFLNNEEITNLVIPEGVTCIKSYAFCVCKDITTIHIPNSVTSIEYRAFLDCSDLTSVSIPNSVTSIGMSSFEDCTGLTSIVIPKDVQHIEGNPFPGCSSLVSIEVESDNTYYDSRDNCKAIIETSSNEMIAGCINSFIPNSVTSIGVSAFYGCSGLTSVTIPNSVTSIGVSAFYGCSGLTSVTIPNSVTSIGLSAFQFCSGLTSVTIPKSVTSIGDAAFWCCNLTRVTIPNSVSCIGKWVFWGCRHLKVVRSMIIEPSEIDPNCWTDVKTDEIPLYVPIGTKTKYESTQGWNIFKNIVELDSSGIPIDTTNFPDENFRNWILSQDYGADGILTEDEIMSVTSMNVSGKSIADLTGIGYFTSLATLYCGDNQLTSLDVSKNTKLVILSCYFNEIKGAAMDALIASLPKTTEATFIAVDHFGTYEKNVVTKAQVEAAKEKGWKTTDSWWLEYEGCDPVTTGIAIDAANFPDENFRNWILSQDYGADGVLTEEEIAKIFMIDVSLKNIADLKGIEFFTALDQLSCHGNQLTSLDISKNSALDVLDCHNNQLASLDVSMNTTLYSLYCDHNQIASLDVSENTKLKWLNCSSNQLTSLDVTNNTLLEDLICDANQLGSLDVSKNTVLVYLSCNNTQLTSLNVSNNLKLDKLYCCNNMINGTAMDALISGLPNRICSFYAISPFSGIEHNIVTKTQVAAAKEKGWTTYYFSENDRWEEYEGSEPELTPVDNGEIVDLGTEISEDTNLDGNVVGNIYYSISSGDGSYNPTEGCLVLTKPTNDLAINLYDIFSEYFKEQFNGLAFKLAPGKGSIKVEAETQGNMVLKVKIGNSDPIEMELDGKLKVKFPYNVSEETLVYIYGGMSTAGAKATGGTRASADADLLKIYGFEIVSDASGIEATESGLPANADAPVYNLNGQRVDTPTKGIYIKNGRKVLVK